MNRAKLVGARSLASKDGPRAKRLYEQAIQSARANGFVHNEALANEFAARFYAARWLRDDRPGVFAGRSLRLSPLGRRGQGAATRSLYPKLRRSASARADEHDRGASRTPRPRDRDQGVAGRVGRDRPGKADRHAHAHRDRAGGRRARAVDFAAGAEQRIAAEATISGDTVIVHPRDEAVTGPRCRSRSSTMSCARRERHSRRCRGREPRLPPIPTSVQHHARSILCLPLINQGKLIGVLYLENNLAPRVFAPARIAVLKLLASQAAIALENTRLYRDLEEREAKIRRLVDANIIGIFIWDFEGRISRPTTRFSRMVGYEREDLVSGRIRWTELTPPEWRERDDADDLGDEDDRPSATIREGVLPERRQPSASADRRGHVRRKRDQGVAFVLDLTERKRAEAEARESERRYREMQMELAHANRVATMGQLTASIAHEVNQPIAATVINAQAAALA